MDVYKAASYLSKHGKDFMDEEQTALLLHMLMMRDVTPPTPKGRVFLSNVTNMLKGRADDDVVSFLVDYFAL